MNFLSVYVHYTQLAFIEVSRHSSLLYSIRTQQEATEIRKILHIEAEELPAAKELLGKEDIIVALDSKITIKERFRLQLVALGEPVVHKDGMPVTNWRMARTMELCFFLLDRSRPIRKEHIITELWSEIDEQTSHTFHTTLYYLRKVFGGKCVVFQSGTYTLQLDTIYGNDIWYDVEVFQTYYAQAKQSLAAGDDDKAQNEFLSMIELYQGDYLQPIYSDWCALKRDELRNVYLDARRSLALIAWRKEAFDESVQHWQRILVIDPSQEEAHYGIMRCYARQGKKGLALHQYRVCQEILQQELNTAPSQTLQRFYQRLLGTS